MGSTRRDVCHESDITRSTHTQPTSNCIPSGQLFWDWKGVHGFGAVYTYRERYLTADQIELRHTNEISLTACPLDSYAGLTWSRWVNMMHVC